MSEYKPLRICNKCGWAHFPQSYQEIKESAESFKAFWDGATDDVRQMYGFDGNVEKLIQRSCSCFRCGNDYKDFHNETQRDHIPMGVTIQGVRYDGEE